MTRCGSSIPSCRRLFRLPNIVLYTIKRSFIIHTMCTQHSAQHPKTKRILPLNSPSNTNESQRICFEILPSYTLSHGWIG